jgi:hypothetical protein
VDGSPDPHRDQDVQVAAGHGQAQEGLAARRQAIRTANGEQEILFTNGSIIMFGAREQGFGRGFDEVDIEVFDEAQILTEKALEDIVPAANQSRQPSGALLFFMGTPPRPTDPGEEFTNRRAKALSGKADNMVYVEFSADPDADPDDREQWAKANPSYPLRTPVESMERMRENLTDDASFKREGLGIWDAVGSNGVIPAPSWADREDERSLASDRFALGVECGPDLAWASVAFAGQRADGEWHFELDEDQHTRGRGVTWLVPHLESLTATTRRSAGLWSTSPARSRRCSRSVTAAGTSRARRSRSPPSRSPNWARAARWCSTASSRAGCGTSGSRSSPQQPSQPASARSVTPACGSGPASRRVRHHPDPGRNAGADRRPRPEPQRQEADPAGWRSKGGVGLVDTNLISVPDLNHSEQKSLDELVGQWREKRPRNNLRAAFYDMQNSERRLMGPNVPTVIRQRRFVLGWSTTRSTS